MIDGKSIYSWNVPALHRGDPEKFVETLVDANFDAVCLKAADGPYKQYVSKLSPWPTWGLNIRPELVSALRGAGLKVYFWQFLYGAYPTRELEVAIEQSDIFEPDGWIWNAEGSFDSKPRAEENARLITSGYQAAHPGIPQSLCWWALPKNPDNDRIHWHPIGVAEAFLRVCTTAMPMMYWQGGTSASHSVSYLEKSLRIWRSFTDAPIIPIGRAYNGDGGVATWASITAFSEAVIARKEASNLVGTSWYSLDKAHQNNSWWDALTQSPSLPTALSLTEKVDRLVDAHPHLFPEFYPKGRPRPM